MKKSSTIYYPLALLIIFFQVSLSGCNEEEVYREADETPSLTIERADNVEYDRITVRFIPNEYTGLVSYALGTEDDRASFENGTFVGIRTQQGNDSFEFTFSYLKPNTTYVAYARAYDAKGKTSGFSSMKLKTYTDAIRISPNFIGVYSAAFDVSVSGDYYKYSYAFGKSSDKEAFANGTLTGIGSVLEKPNRTFNSFNLQPSTKYSFFFVAYDRGDNPTKVYEIPFETASTATGPAVSSFSVSAPSMLYRSFSINVNEPCSRAVVSIREKGGFDNYLTEMYNSWDGDVKKMMISWESLGAGVLVDAIFNTKTYSFTEQTTALFLDVNPYNRPYEVYILLYDKEGEPFAVEYRTFNSPSFDSSAAAAVVKIDKIVVEPQKATYYISWDKNTLAVALQTYEADYYLTLTEEEIYSFLAGQIYEATNSSMTYSEATVSTTYPPFDYTGKTIHLIVAGINKNGLDKGLGTYVMKSFVAGQTN